MVPHSSTLAWRIPWTEEPGRLQSMGSHRVWHDWTTKRTLLTIFIIVHWRESSACWKSLETKGNIYLTIHANRPGALCFAEQSNLHRASRNSSRHTPLKNSFPGISLMVQQLRIHLAMQEMWVQSLVRELRPHMLWGSWAWTLQPESPCATKKILHDAVGHT